MRVTAMAASGPKVPWHEYGDMLREIAVGHPFLISLGLSIPNRKLTCRYFSWLHKRGLIRLKTTVEIMAQVPTALA